MLLKAASVTQNHVLNAFTNSEGKTDVTVLQRIKRGRLPPQTV